METYQQALTYIHTRPKKHRSADLTNMHRILKALGEPQRAFKGIHVTGTNGKGSVTQILSHLIIKRGFKVGTFMSPFIRRFNERIQVDLTPIPDEALVYWTNQVQAQILAIQKEDPDFELVEFELVTAIMFAYFKAEQIDIAVIEVGIGGAHDKTNVFTPLLSVITTVGLDHVQLIGPTLADIAVEKSGIIKLKRPVVVGAVPPQVAEILQAKAQQMQSPFYQLNEDFATTRVTLTPDYRQTFDFTNATQQLKNVTIQSIARFEVDNTAVALQAFFVFCELLKLEVPQTELKAEIAEVQLIGRLEIIHQTPFIILDGAHNPQAMTRLFESIRQGFANTEIHVIAAFMKDKAVAQLVKILHQNQYNKLYLTTLDMPRAAKKTDIQPYLTSTDQYFETWQAAFNAAYHSISQDDVILVCGSIYLVSEVRHYLMEGGA